jgi:hypothetical protein
MQEQSMTKLKVADGNEGSPLAGKVGASGIYRSMLAAGRQKAFQSILTDTQSDGAGIAGTGKTIPHMEPAAQHLGDSTSIDPTSKIRPNVMEALDKGGLDNLATAALLKAAALASPNSSALKYYSLKGMGLGSGAAMPFSGATTGSGVDYDRGSALKAPRGSYATGSVSAAFESGENGVDVIGYDSNGGTSYGTYQISSRQGTMNAFLDYLDGRAPEWAAKLRAAGSANTGSRTGGMPTAWKQIAAQDPERFAAIQHDFIEESHYLPALQEVIERANLDVSQRSKALQETLWSTAVQHGPFGAAKIFTRAVERASAKGGDVENISDAEIIERVYAGRAGNFGSSSARVRNAVAGRFGEEKEMILAMLENEGRRV